MTIPRLVAMQKRWEQQPPLNVTAYALAQAFGFKPKKAEQGRPEDLMALMGGAGGFSTEKPEWLKEAQAAEMMASPSTSAPSSTR